MNKGPDLLQDSSGNAHQDHRVQPGLRNVLENSAGMSGIPHQQGFCGKATQQIMLCVNFSIVREGRYKVHTGAAQTAIDSVC
jgi:hypothetical protein